MISMKKFIHSIPAIFQSEVAREQRALAELEHQRQQREHRQTIVRQAADLRDRIVAVRASFAAFSAKVDGFLNFPCEQVYRDCVESRIPPEVAGERLAGLEAFARHAKKIKQFAQTQIVTTAENRLAAFEKENAAALKGVEFVAADEPPFVPLELPINHYDGASAKLVEQGIAR
jgi:hypothetical protein